jgi:hypothetical protein
VERWVTLADAFHYTACFAFAAPLAQIDPAAAIPPQCSCDFTSKSAEFDYSHGTCASGYRHPTSSDVTKVQLSPDVHFYRYKTNFSATGGKWGVMWGDDTGVIAECRNRQYRRTSTTKLSAAYAMCSSTVHRSRDEVIEICRTDPDCNVVFYESGKKYTFATGACMSPCLKTGEVMRLLDYLLCIARGWLPEQRCHPSATAPLSLLTSLAHHSFGAHSMLPALPPPQPTTDYWKRSAYFVGNWVNPFLANASSPAVAAANAPAMTFRLEVTTPNRTFATAVRRALGGSSSNSTASRSVLAALVTDAGFRASWPSRNAGGGWGGVRTEDFSAGLTSGDVLTAAPTATPTPAPTATPTPAPTATPTPAPTATPTPAPTATATATLAPPLAEANPTPAPAAAPTANPIPPQPTPAPTPAAPVGTRVTTTTTTTVVTASVKVPVTLVLTCAHAEAQVATVADATLASLSLASPPWTATGRVDTCQDSRRLLGPSHRQLAASATISTELNASFLLVRTTQTQTATTPGSSVNAPSSSSSSSSSSSTISVHVDGATGLVRGGISGVINATTLAAAAATAASALVTDVAARSASIASAVATSVSESVGTTVTVTVAAAVRAPVVTAAPTSVTSTAIATGAPTASPTSESELDPPPAARSAEPESSTGVAVGVGVAAAVIVVALATAYKCKRSKSSPPPPLTHACKDKGNGSAEQQQPTLASLQLTETAVVGTVDV